MFQEAHFTPRPRSTISGTILFHSVTLVSILPSEPNTERFTVCGLSETNVPFLSAVLNEIVKPLVSSAGASVI